MLDRYAAPVSDPEPDPGPSSVPACVFCDVIDGRRPAHMVLDDEVAVGFLDISPLFPGHTLVVPRRHVVTLPDLDAATVGPFFERVQLMARAMVEVLGAQGTFVANNNIVSQSVAHLHVHVVPRRRKDGLRGFFWPRQRYEDGQADDVARRLSDGIAAMHSTS